MTRSHNIVLGLPNERLPADEAAEVQRAGMHWRRWRRGGAAISAGLHGLLALVIVAGWPQFGAQAEREGAQAEREKEEPVTVEIVQKPPEPEKPAEPPPKKEEAAKQLDLELPKEKPEPLKQKAEAPPQAPAPPPPPAAPPAAPGAQASPQPPPDWKWPTPAAPPQMAELPTQLGPVPRAAPAPGGERQGPDGGLKVEPDVVALPDQKEEKALDHWVLDPLTLDLRDKCGVARISAVIEIKERVAEGQYRGTLRNTIRWARCPATGAVYHVELRISGAEVALIGAEGFTDRGVMRNGVMMLEDAYGRSVWRKR